MKNEIQKRRGKVIVSRQLLRSEDEKILKALFSNFYPIATEPYHDNGYYNDVLYFGYSPHFDIIKEGDVIPGYDFRFKRDNNGNVSIDSVNKLKP